MFRIAAPAKSILIVGAGPAGLTLGIELLRRGVPCCVIDALHAPATTSRAFTVHARTLELFEMMGIIDPFLEQGLRGISMDYRFHDAGQIVRLDFTTLNSKYPCFRIISQTDTEQILREHFLRLGGVIDWHTELRAVTVDDGAVTATLFDTAGRRTETVQPDWLIGCDGAHSVVRRLIGADFPGARDHGAVMWMTDAPLTGRPGEAGRVCYDIGADHMLLTTQLPNGTWRVLVSGAGDTDSVDSSPEAFQKILDQHFDGTVILGDPQWTSVFQVGRYLSATYRQGPILLCGDAAHLQAPVGGQGMNVAIQDAVNLGWKLAAVATGAVGPALLDTYEQERRPIGEKVIADTDELHSVILNHGVPLTERLAKTQEPGFLDRAVRNISGIAYRYRDTTTASLLRGLGLGDRAPDVEA
ncbi:FAD-dependent monooxygenase [Nocardia sp. NPDC050799]|uniref:FAD-dependent monooxygenase n=1 Tax=Nocardia sp. NPDC050799 TaxID=3154842 RepID=UPI0033CE2914